MGGIEKPEKHYKFSKSKAPRCGCKKVRKGGGGDYTYQVKVLFILLGIRARLGLLGIKTYLAFYCIPIVRWWLDNVHLNVN